MKNSIKTELEAHVTALINDEVLTEDNKDDWHFHAFNEDYYIIGYYNAEEWLKGHNISPFEAIETIRDYEMENFGEVSTKFDNPESVVNMYIYILGEQIIQEMA